MSAGLVMSFFFLDQGGGHTKSKHRIMCKVDVPITLASVESGKYSSQRMFQWEMNIIMEA